MHKFLRGMGMIAWVGCVLTLIYQGLVWGVTASWTNLSLMDVSSTLLGIDLATLIQEMPIDYAVKATYVLITTDLAIGLWWAGIAFFAMAVISKVVFNK
ncbi:potassium:proton antiporter [Pseudodesulfovibrio sp. zrk46]|uniref:potassium:proton antiporter n=1 Tax=Pseudodesulfovibrio sp. zrk46 TaxID=2725288 RepID=UPI00144981E4|nr:potassium:proton antiporter [Pseudodesulfovibrio sp. zrk46]QJB57969.1 potassium:proton antiporter [Pseudodesulfovibrio sp. zrk46]